MSTESSPTEEIRELRLENASLRLTVKLLQQKIERLTHADPWPMPKRTADPIPPDTWGD